MVEICQAYRGMTFISEKKKKSKLISQKKSPQKLQIQLQTKFKLFCWCVMKVIVLVYESELTQALCECSECTIPVFSQNYEIHLLKNIFNK